MLQECSIIRACDNLKFEGYAWSIVRGFEAFWYEGGKRRHMVFASNGKQYGFLRHKYTLELEG